MSDRKVIPVLPARADAVHDCDSGESFALQVLGDSMEPEFSEGEIIVVEPEGLAAHGSFVVANVDGEWTFRQLALADSRWQLRPLNPSYPTVALSDLAPIKGVVIQKSTPGRRRASKRYVE